ncbi:MAG: hypothetical protein ABIA75_04220 [Candidatus Neomarinimicrobiota bacterium]
MRTTAQILVVLSLLSGLTAQIQYTLPNNVWRVSVSRTQSQGDWVSGAGYAGSGPQEFTLEGYGRRYYDHLEPDAYYDLYNLDSLRIGRSYSGAIIRGFNNSLSAMIWNDTLPDFSNEFFGPDSVTVGGFLINTSNRRTVARRDISLEYGISNRATFSLELPYYDSVEERRQWRWSGTPPAGLAEFIAYQDSARQKFDDFAAFFDIIPMNQDTLAMLLDIRERLYTWDGNSSVLWALAGGTDPLQTGITGSAYNPFASDDTSATTIDSLIAWYLPAYRRISGLGDITLRLTFLLAGKPVWSRAGFYSVYTGVAVRLPLARRLSRFDPEDTDSAGRPAQFSEYPLGTGSTRWTVAFFGEFYKFLFNRLIGINWYGSLSISSREFLNFPVSLAGTNLTVPDSIVARYGYQYGHRPGWEGQGRIAANLELWPDRILLRPQLTAYYRGRDRFYSTSDAWNHSQEFRRYDGRIVYDTRILQLTPQVSLLLRNLHPIRKIGPLPFELEIGGSKPVFTRHNYSDYALWLKLTTYFQSW